MTHTERTAAYRKQLQARLERQAEDAEYAELRAQAPPPFVVDLTDRGTGTLLELAVELARAQATVVAFAPPEQWSVRADRLRAGREVAIRFERGDAA